MFMLSYVQDSIDVNDGHSGFVQYGRSDIWDGFVLRIKKILLRIKSNYFFLIVKYAIIVLNCTCIYYKSKSIPIKCFVSHRPPPRKVGSVGRIKKKSIKK